MLDSISYDKPVIGFGAFSKFSILYMGRQLAHLRLNEDLLELHLIKMRI